MTDKNIAKKEKAIELMKRLDIYKPYIKGFRESDKVCFFEGFGGFWIDQEPEVYAKMKAIEEKYGCLVYAVTHEFTPFGECYSFLIVSDYPEEWDDFQTKYINYLKAICRENHWQLVNVGRNHYCFSAFIKSAENKCVYISISDVRYFTNEWFSHILIRTAKDEQDYRGGFNHHTTLENLDVKAAELLEDLPF